MEPQPTTPGSAVRHRPSRRPYIIAFVLIAAGVVLVPTVIVASVFLALGRAQAGTQFAAPGQATVTVSEPGTMIIWHETSGVIDGRTHTAPQHPPVGLIVTVHDAATGAEIPVRPNTSSVVTLGTTERQSLMEFTAPAAGQYSVTAGGVAQPHVLFVGQSIMGSMMTAIGVSLLAALVGLAMSVGGVLIIVFTARNRGRSAALAA